MVNDSSRAKVRILVADDQVEARSVVQSVLSNVGYLNIFQATSGTDAIQTAIERRVHLVLCDWNMPGASGLDVLNKLRKHPDHLTTPFILLTAEAYKENVKQALKAGVTAYMVKPITTKELLLQVDLALKHVTDNL
jgi:CheY-like chemotaxis protein